MWLMGFALWLPRLAMPHVDPQRAAIVLFTSGSEDRPKGVVISHAALLANMAQLQAVIDFGPNDKYFSSLPLYHSFGLIACALMPLMTGTKLFLYISPLHFHSIPDLVYQSDATYIFGTSTFLGHYARNAHPYDFQSVRKVICGGEKLGKEVARLWRTRFGLRVLEGYGATECGPAMSLNTPLAFREGSVGRLLPGVEHRLRQVPGLVIGSVLHVRSPNLMMGYLHFENPGVVVPPKSECGEGWYSTGDVVEIDEDGFMAVIGRTRRFAKIAGEMVSLDLIERIAAHSSPDCAHAATLKQVEGYGESTVLFTTDAKLDRMTLVRAAREMQAPEIAISRHIVKVDQLPLTGNGKIDYVTLRLRAENYNV
jgi:acyl-[acyl-carrier-protein]-phospholipid O-acyltransferase/long-chain-fatty-acid--[acyl-carrier-protein] ligase